MALGDTNLFDLVIDVRERLRIEDWYGDCIKDGVRAGLSQTKIEPR